MRRFGVVLAAAAAAAAAGAGCGSRNVVDAGGVDRVMTSDAPVVDAPLDISTGADAGPRDVASNDDRPSAADERPGDTTLTDARVDGGGGPNDALPVRGDALPPVSPGETVCYASGWCWSFPTPLGGQIAVWAGAADDVWVVGQHGVTRHFDGQSWTNVSTPTTANLETVWGAARDKVWAAGDDVVLFWDGARWTTVAPPTDAGGSPFGGDVIRGASASDVWLASSKSSTVSPGAVWHFDGAQWQLWSQRFGARELWVDPAASVYATPTAVGTTLVRKGLADATFRRVDTTPFAGAPSGVWSGAPNDIWLVYFDGLVHFDGSSWSTRLVLPKTPSFEQLERVAGSDSDDVWFSERNGDMLRWNGVGFERWPVAATGLDRISLRSRDDVWAAGRGGALVHFDGSNWRRLSSHESLGDLGAVAGVGADEVWAVGLTVTRDPQSARYRPATGWEAIPMPPGGLAFMKGLWGSGPDDVWAVAAAYPIVPGVSPPNPVLTPIYHWQGGAWTRLTGYDNAYFADVWGAAANDVWIVGEMNLRWDGAAFTKVAGTNAPVGGVAISGTAPNDVWIVNGKVVHHFDGTAWSASQPLPASSTQSLVGIWARRANDIFAWSPEEIYRFDGQVWRSIHSYPPNTSPLLGHFSVHGSNTELWATTFAGLVERWDGTTWKTDEQAGSSTIIRVTTRDVWLGSYGGGGLMRKARVP
jgi:hypothetical protein